MQKLQPIKDARKAKALRAHFFPSKSKIESEYTQANRRKQAKTRGFNFYIKFISKNC